MSVATQPSALRARPRATGRFAVRLSVWVGGEPVDEAFVDPGHDALIDGRPSSPVRAAPPPGSAFVARLHWVGRDRVQVTDGQGATHELGPDEGLLLDLSAYSVRIQVVPRFWLRRSEPLRVAGSLNLLAMVLALTLTSAQADWVAAERCTLLEDLRPWIGEDAVAQWMVPLGCVREESQGGNPAAFMPEYLKRLLDKDYAGEDDGALELQQRDDAKQEWVSFYMPAGQAGEDDALGGADEVAPEPVRSPEQHREESLPAEQVRPDESLSAPDGTPVPESPPLEVPLDATADGVTLDSEGGEDDGESEAPAEDKRGWGIQDWYDAKDKALDDLEIEMYQSRAKQRLRIDPDDRDALSILSYYQYLAEDYDAAAETYDRYIRLFPDESAGYNNKALIYKRRGEYRQEEDLYRVALAIAPGDVTTLNNLAVNLAHQGRYDEALALMRDLETLDPGEPYADLHRAKIYAEMGEDERALQYLDLSLQGMQKLDTLHHIEFRQDIRLDPSFAKLRQDRRFLDILFKYYGEDTPVEE